MLARAQFAELAQAEFDAAVEYHQVEANAEGTRLLHQRHQRPLSRRVVGMRRKEAVHLVEHHQASQALRAG
jgi:hypothetical protein